MPTEKGTNFHFRIRYATAYGGLNGQILEFEEPESGIKFMLQDRMKTEGGRKSDELNCEVTCTRVVSERLSNAAQKSKSLSMKKGRVKEINTELNDFAHRTLRCARWRLGITDSAGPIRHSRGLEWSDDRYKWYLVSDNLYAQLSFGIASHCWTPELMLAIETMVKEHQDEPEVRELFLEATSIRSGSPRSALVLGVAAAEIGLKRFIIERLPQTEWLLMNVPSPPIEKILEYMFPLAVGNGAYIRVGAEERAPFMPKSIVSELRKAIQLRNKLVHVGEIAPNSTTIDKILQAINDFLNLLDAYGGVRWALSNVSVEAHAAIKSEMAVQTEKS